MANATRKDQEENDATDKFGMDEHASYMTQEAEEERRNAKLERQMDRNNTETPKLGEGSRPIHGRLKADLSSRRDNMILPVALSDAKYQPKEADLD
jgi:hypothetical protein